MVTDNSELLRQQELVSIGSNIELKPVISSNIGGIGYNEEHKLLKVTFKNKTGFSTYLYENVEPNQYQDIISSQSIGKMLSESIIKHKDKHNYIKV